ncbi:MAG: hypothetical protein ACXAEN_21515 [Candidatus Thorarchaeota archaeon]|jgi:hypothetical protein
MKIRNKRLKAKSTFRLTMDFTAGSRQQITNVIRMAHIAKLMAEAEGKMEHKGWTHKDTKVETVFEINGQRVDLDKCAHLTSHEYDTGPCWRCGKNEWWHKYRYYFKTLYPMEIITESGQIELLAICSSCGQYRIEEDGEPLPDNWRDYTLHELCKEDKEEVIS